MMERNQGSEEGKCLSNIVQGSFSEKVPLELTQEWGEGAVCEKIWGQGIQVEGRAAANRIEMDQLEVFKYRKKTSVATAW